MAYQIRSLNNQHLTAAKTYLAGDLSAGTNSSLVKNHNNFYTSWAVQIGETGEERTEILLVNGTPAGGTVNFTGNTRYNHPTDTPVYCYRYDQLVVKRSTTGTSGTATTLTDGTVSITPDQYDIDGNSYTSSGTVDLGTSTTSAFKTSLRNSILAVEGPDSDWIVTGGYDFYSLYRLRDRAKNKLLNQVKDSVIDEWLNEWHESMTNGLIEINRDYAIGTTTVAFGANSQFGTITDADFKLPRHVVLLDAAGTHEVFPKELTDNIPVNSSFVSGRDSYFFRGDTVIGRSPYSQAGTLQIEYYKLNPTLSNDTDTLPLPMRGYTRSYVKYVQAQAAYLDNNEKLAQILESEANGMRSQFMQEMSPRQQDGPEYVKIVNPIQRVF